MATIETTLSVCGNCRIVLANDDWSGIPEDEVEDYERRYNEGIKRELGGRNGNIVAGGEHHCNHNSECECEYFGYCTYECELCRDGLHGDRFAATILIDD